jgi:hypothetical protein
VPRLFLTPAALRMTAIKSDSLISLISSEVRGRQLQGAWEEMARRESMPPPVPAQRKGGRSAGQSNGADGSRGRAVADNEFGNWAIEKSTLPLMKVIRANVELMNQPRQRQMRIARYAAFSARDSVAKMQVPGERST